MEQNKGGPQEQGGFAVGCQDAWDADRPVLWLGIWLAVTPTVDWVVKMLWGREEALW